MDQDLGHSLRVRWDRATNMFGSFYRDLAEVRRAVGDEHFPAWCISHLRLGVSVIYKVSGILTETDAAIEKDNLRRAKEAERAANRLKRETKAKEAAEQRRLREAARASKQPPPLPAPPKKGRTSEPSPKTKWRQRMIGRAAIDEVRKAVAAGRISISRGAEIAGAPADMQSRLLDVAPCKSRQNHRGPGA